MIKQRQSHGEVIGEAFWSIPMSVLNFNGIITGLQTIYRILHICIICNMIHGIHTVSEARSRYLREAEPTSCYVEQPSPSSAVSVYPPWYTLSANLQEVQTFWAQPIKIQKKLECCYLIQLFIHWN